MAVDSNAASAPNAEEPLLAAKGLRVALGGALVLQDVDLVVPAGRVVGVLGPSGAGKSTLFRALVGELVPSSGTVHLRGVDVTALPLWRRARLGLGYIPQGPNVLLDLTVEQNLRSFERACGVAPRPPAERAAAVQLDGRLSVRARDLSGGERRRLELLRGLIADPSVLVCDEPFAGGDPIHVQVLAKLLGAHARRGRSVLLADHRIADALDICDEALLLVEGRVALRGPAADFADDPAVRGRYLGAR